MASWTTNIIQTSLKSCKRSFLGNYRTTLLGTIFGKLYGFALEKNNKSMNIIETRQMIGQACFREDRSICGPHSYYVCYNWTRNVCKSMPLFLFYWLQKDFDTFHITSFECPRQLGISSHLQQSIKAKYTTIYAKNTNQRWQTWQSHVWHQC